MPYSSTGVSAAVVSGARPAPSSSQPIRLAGRCTARMPPQPANPTPIAVLVSV